MKITDSRLKVSGLFLESFELKIKMLKKQFLKLNKLRLRESFVIQVIKKIDLVEICWIGFCG